MKGSSRNTGWEVILQKKKEENQRKLFQFFSKTRLKIMKISQYKGYITTGRF